MPTMMHAAELGRGAREPSGRPGRMTAVMRAAAQAAGPKVLRVGLVVGGRILEERLVKQRTSVTVGPSEGATFMVQERVPSQFKLFEMVGGEYHLNVLDGMTGRIAMQTGIADLGTLGGHARRLGAARQVRLTEEARGKVTVGDTTFLFQFVAPPPAHQQPQLPLSVKGGLAHQVDWRFAVIAAFSFLVHFGFVGALYGDWIDPIVDDDVSATFLATVKKADPLPVEAPSASKSTAAATEAPVAVSPRPDPSASQEGRPPSAQALSGLLNQANHTRVAILAALGAAGPALQATLGANDSVAPVNLNDLATKSDGIKNTNGSDLNLLGTAGPIEKSASFESVQIETVAAVSTAGPIVKVVPVDVQSTTPAISVPVANAEATIRSQIHPGARRCYQQGLQSDPTQAGRLVLLIKVGPSGEVDLASVSSNGGLSAGVASCIAKVARRAKFDAPGANGSILSVPFAFVRQGG